MKMTPNQQRSVAETVASSFVINGTDPTYTVDRHLSGLDLTTDKINEVQRPMVSELCKIGEDGRALIHRALDGISSRQIAAQERSKAVLQAGFRAVDDHRLRGAQSWAEQTRSLQSLTFDMPREDVSNFLQGVKEMSDIRLQTSADQFKDDLSAITDQAASHHSEQMKAIKEFSAEAEAFRGMLMSLVEIQEKALSVIAENWKGTRMHQLQCVRDAITLVIRDREDRRKGMREAKDMHAEWSDQVHRQHLDVQRQDQQETMDHENLSQKRCSQERADNLAQKRLALEEVLARLNHDLDMNRDKAKDSSFWMALVRPFM